MLRSLLVGLLPLALVTWQTGEGFADNAAEPNPAAAGAAGARPAIAGQVEAQGSASPGSVSCGAVNRGALASPAVLDHEGPGFVIPETWRKRGLNYGTDELVAMIKRSAAAVASQHAGSVLGVADLSLERGGAARQHRSHQSGRDVDLLFYALDPQGQPFPPDKYMPIYNRKGRAYYAESPEWTRHIAERYFDLARNWALVKAMITDRETQVVGIFVSRRIKRWLLDYAKANGETKEIIDLARKVVQCPRNAKAHNDHMHVRIACPSGDITHGRCRNHLAPRRRRGGKWHWRIRCPKKPKATIAVR